MVQNMWTALTRVGIRVSTEGTQWAAVYTCNFYRKLTNYVYILMKYRFGVVNISRD